MKIKIVCERSQLTDRAIRYYIEEELIAPSYTENYLGRKTFDFSEEDVKALQDIAVLRKFGFTIEEIKLLIANVANSPGILFAVRVRKQQTINEEQAALNALSFFDAEKVYTVSEIAEVLKAPVGERIIPKEDSLQNRWKLFGERVQYTLLKIFAWLFIFLWLGDILILSVYYRYLHFSKDIYIYSLFLLLPSIIIFLLFKLKKQKKGGEMGRVIRILSLFLLVPYFLFHFNFPILSFGYSETTDIADYRRLDEECLVICLDFFHEFFPWQVYGDIPFDEKENKEDAGYYYRFISSFNTTHDVYAEWSLPQEVFDQEVARVKELFAEYQEGETYFKYVEMQKGAYNCLIFCSGYSVDTLFEPVTDSYDYYIFAYDEENLRVRYIACYSLENGVDQPYYLELDW